VTELVSVSTVTSRGVLCWGILAPGCMSFFNVQTNVHGEDHEETENVEGELERAISEWSQDEG